EFNNPLASKGEGVRALASMLDIPLSQVVCVGDNENDISMLKVAGLAVAVDNATDFAKNASTYITTSVLDDGVGKLIDYLLKE
ncbi:MAG: HAD hydrolase family protein, partial [Clostridia bacterium]